MLEQFQRELKRESWQIADHLRGYDLRQRSGQCRSITGKPL